MRLTTKIVIGIILLIFILSISFIVIFSFTDRRNYNTYYDSGVSISKEKMIVKEVKPYKTIKLDVSPEEQRYMRLIGELRIEPITNESERNKISIPEELSEFTEIDSSGDTLIIRISSYERIYEKFLYEKKKSEMIIRVLSGVTILAHTDVVDVLNNSGGINVNVSNIETDSIKINTRSEINIQNCKSNFVEPLMNNGYEMLRIRNSQIRELNINLDIIWNWEVLDCDVERENLIGSGHHSTRMIKSKDRNVNVYWLPKNKDARLQVTFEGDTAQVTFP